MQQNENKKIRIVASTKSEIESHIVNGNKINTNLNNPFFILNEVLDMFLQSIFKTK